ncbi:DsbC family protein [Candidatus Litorirhabdus singularis]|nr:DsbC family protein [Candidatus Litorirhabdus singularis]
MRFTHLGRYLAFAVLLSVAQGALAAATPEDLIRERLTQARPDFNILSIKQSEVKGMYEVQIAAGPLVYVTADATHFFLGDLFAVNDDGLVNIAEQRRDDSRKSLLAEVSMQDMIVYPATGETRARVTIFTDVDCFYCQKLHQEVPQMNAMGIEIRYLAYPRSGIGGDSYRKIASAWCAADPNAAMNKLKNRESIAQNVCEDNPVADQFALGQEMGVRGTPAMVLESGQMVPGYLSAADLAARLGIN